jgi:hypothetical protein
VPGAFLGNTSSTEPRPTSRPGTPSSPAAAALHAFTGLLDRHRGLAGLVELNLGLAGLLDLDVGLGSLEGHSWFAARDLDLRLALGLDSHLRFLGLHLDGLLLGRSATWT